MSFPPKVIKIFFYISSECHKFFLWHLHLHACRIHFVHGVRKGSDFIFHLGTQYQHYFLIDMQYHLCHISNFHTHESVFGALYIICFLSLFLGFVLHIICLFTSLPPKKTLFSSRISWPFNLLCKFRVILSHSSNIPLEYWLEVHWVYRSIWDI